MLSKSQYTLKHEQLLRDLKTIIDGLLSTQVANVWSIYGGLNRLHNLMELIFKHGCKNIGCINGPFFEFIQGLEWLQPNTSNCYFSVECEYQPYIPTHLKNNPASIWLYRSLKNLSLSTKLSWLLSDKNHLDSCYYPHAFLCNAEYTEALLICLKALERNQPSLMSEINPCLFLLQPNATDIHKLHRRCSSFPERFLNKCDSKTEGNYKVESRHSICNFPNESDRNEEISRVLSKLKPWSSTPNLFLDRMEVIKEIIQSKTAPNTPIHVKKNLKVQTTKKCTFFKNKENISQISQGISCITKKHVKPYVIDNRDIIEHTPPLSTSCSSGTTVGDKFGQSLSKPERKISVGSPRSVVDYSFSALPGEKDYKKLPKRSFIEGGGNSVLPMSTGYFPKPMKGQSLMSFLTSSQFNRPNAELDRENAHFSISEAIISALEQIRCKQDLKLSDENIDESDPEILDLKQRIRVRRRQKMAEKQRRLWSSSVLNSGKSDTATTVSPPSTTSDTYSECSSSDNIEDIEIDEASNLLENKGLSNSMASLYSEVDLKRTRGVPDGASDVFSAESVAISLMSRFKAKQLPKASELEWLVSEEDAPQALLPLPNSWPVSPDDSEAFSISLRGTQDWAPPRPQIIFTLHPSTTRKQLMMKQNYRCAGCSMKVVPKYASKYRYCEYLGRYFCTGCHANQLSLIPARILQKWDFSRYPVSTFSYRLLEQMYTDPLFRVFDLNKKIGKVAKDLEFCKQYRLGLYYIKDFIFSCKSTDSIKDIISNEIKNSLEEIDIYSLEDLVKIKSGEMKTKLTFLVNMCLQHIAQCQICMGRGHICEKCKADPVIFPWQTRFISRCEKCGTCYHKPCWKVGVHPCIKCMRLSKRRESDVSLPQEDLP